MSSHMRRTDVELLRRRLINIRVKSVFIVSDDLTDETKYSFAIIFIWLKPLSQSAVDTAMVFI